MCEKLFLKAQNIYSLLFHFLQLFVCREQMGLNLVKINLYHLYLFLLQ